MVRRKPTTKRILSPERCLLAHDLHNDLHVILGRCELLTPLLEAGTEEARHLRMIKEAADGMADNLAGRPCRNLDLKEQIQGAVPPALLFTIK